MIEFKYIMSTIMIIMLCGFLITMIYFIRSTIPKGPYTWISNLANFTLFLIIILCLILCLAYTPPTNMREEDISLNPLDTNLELKSAYSTFISKYAMFPLLVVEMVIFVSMNSRLLWIWFYNGDWDTIVNKFIIINRICGVIYIIGCVVDYWLRLYGSEIFTYMSADTYCSCWIIFYKTMFYTCSTTSFSAAVIRLLCVEFSIEYHNWCWSYFLFIPFLKSFVCTGTQVTRPKEVSFSKCWWDFSLLHSHLFYLTRPVFIFTKSSSRFVLFMSPCMSNSSTIFRV